MASNRFTQFTSFPKRLAHSWQHSNSMLCVGLDPDVSRMPEGYGTSPAEIERFCMEIVKATAEFCLRIQTANCLLCCQSR